MKHSDNKIHDDFHRPKGIKYQIKKETFNRKGDFGKQVGKNPDIEISDLTGEILLIGVAENVKGNIFQTGINVADERYFKPLYLFIHSTHDFIEFTLCEIQKIHLEENIATDIVLEKFYVIPNDKIVFDKLLVALYNKALLTTNQKTFWYQILIEK